MQVTYWTCQTDAMRSSDGLTPKSESYKHRRTLEDHASSDADARAITLSEAYCCSEIIVIVVRADSSHRCWLAVMA